MIKILGKALWFLVGLSLYSTLLNGGSVSSKVDEKEVVLGDSVLFTITVVGEESDPLPEMDEIVGVPVLNIMRHKGSDFVYVNGKSVMEQTQSITFEFKPTSNMTIPAFQMSVDGVLRFTNAIPIKVLTLAEGEKRKNKFYSIEVQLNKVKVYVGEPLVATVLLKYKTALEIMSLEYSKPVFKGFFAKELKGEEKYKEGSYTVNKLNYLLTAKEEGVFKIGIAKAKIAQRVREKQEGGWFANVPKWINIISEAVEIEVSKPSVDYDLMGKFTLKENIDTQKVKANKPIHLTFELTGEGDLEDFEGIDFDIEGVTIYGDYAELESKIVDEKLESHYRKSFVFIANHDFIIPSQSISLFDYKSAKVKVLKTRSYKIEVEGSKESIAKAIVHTKQESQSQSIENKIEKNSLRAFTFPSFLILFLTFMLGAFTTLFLSYLLPIIENSYPKLSRKLLRKWRAIELGFDGHEALQVLYPHVGESLEVEQMVRQLYAIKNGDKSVKIEKELLLKLLKKYRLKTEQ